MRYLAKMPAAVSGQGGHDQAFEAARVIVWGFNLGIESGLRVLLDNYNPRCQPPWSEKELRHKCEDADRVPFDKPRGWLLGGAPPPNSNGDGAPSEGPPPVSLASRGEEPDVPEVLIGVDQHRVNDEVVAALARDPDCTPAANC